MKIIASSFTKEMSDAGAKVGFVLAQDDQGVNRLYVGIGTGSVVQADEQWIAKWGNEITDDSPIFKMLYAAARSYADNSMMLVKSGYGWNTQKPFVELESSHLDKPLQMSPAEARGVGINLFEAADSAESEAFLIHFFKGMDLNKNVVGSLLMDFRKFRDEHREDPPKSTPAEEL